MLTGGGLALVVACYSPTPRTLFSLAGALMLIWLLSVLPGATSKIPWFSLRIHPGLFVLVTTCCLCLVLCELALRIFFFQAFPDFKRMTRPTFGYQYDPELGWFPAPRTEATFDFVHGTIPIAHNSKGFRDIEPSFDARPGVLFLGDSFVWGYAVDAADRFSDRVRSRHPEWQVYNFGVSGYGTDQEYLLLQEHFQDYHPRVVFLVFCTENDHIDNCSHGDASWAFKPYFRIGSHGLMLRGVPVPCSDRIFFLQHPLLSKSYLNRLVMRAWGNFRSPPPLATTDPTNALLEALHKFVADHGAVFCVGLTGADPQVERFLASSRIPYLDLSTDLKLEGDWHWSSRGNAFVAEKIEKFLIAAKYL
jgi:hypothetical protein